MTGYLIAGPAWVGDMVMAQSLIISLKRRDPDAAIDVIAPGWSVSLAQRMVEVREAIPLPGAHRELAWSKRRSLGRSLRSRSYQQAIVLPRSLKSALVPWIARIPKRTGYRGEWRFGVLNDVRTTDPLRTVPPAWRWMVLGYPADAEVPATVPYPRLQADKENQHRLVQALNLHTDGPVVALVPGAEHRRVKRWPVDYFARLACTLTEQGIAVWLLGSAKETALAETIATQAGEGVVNLCGRTTLLDALDLLALTDAVICNDSGLMHVAAATGVFVVALFGPTTPGYTGPLTDNSSVIYLNLDCSPCKGGECPLDHHSCMRQISPEMVAEALSRKISGSAGTGRFMQPQLPPDVSGP